MKAIICDLDGTLCDVEHRRHLAQSKQYDKFNKACSGDPCVEPIARLLYSMNAGDYYVLLCSGRDGKYREETLDWLEDFNISYDSLYMRAEGDYRPDVVVKREMLRQIEQEGYEVIFVVDDRQQVVDMWREEGLTCLQCAPGDFDTVSPKYEPGILHLLVGPSGAGKSTYFETNYDEFPYNIRVSSDDLRQELCGDWKDQSKNQQVFNALHAIVKARIANGLDTVVDATNIKDADRRALRSLTTGNIVYHVIDRPLAEKKRDGGWRNETMIGGLTLIEKHDSVFKSNLKAILRGDDDPRVTVKDMRNG